MITLDTESFASSYNGAYIPNSTCIQEKEKWHTTYTYIVRTYNWSWRSYSKGSVVFEAVTYREVWAASIDVYERAGQCRQYIRSYCE